MTASNQESYWRIYLLLHEGSPLIFKQLIAREIEKCGGDIDALLLKHKKKLCEDLSILDADILFPGSKKTDIDKWNADIFPCVIFTLFSKTLQQVEKQIIRRIQTVQDDIEELPEISLDHDAFGDLEQTLPQTLRKLAHLVSNEKEVVTKLYELVKVFIKEPLNFADLLSNISKFNLLNKIHQKLKVFIEAHIRKENTSTEDVHEGTLDTHTSVKNEVGSVGVYGTSRNSNVSLEAQTDIDETPKLEQAIGGFDEICCGSENVTTLDLEYGDRIIVQNVEGGLTEQEARSTILLWQNTDIEKGMRGKSLDDMAKKKLEAWEKVQVKVAVLGRPGVGKSRFINAIRGCTSKTDPFYAQVGSTETTTKAECYPHPKNKQLELYDLPGIGTARFPREKFIGDDRINFQAYDIYLIMASDRFTTDETYFARCVEQSGKTFLFVRTRVDIDLDEADDKKAEIEKMRAECEQNLRDMTIKATDVFLISSKHADHHLLDFDKLIEWLVNSLSGLKKEAMMFSLQFNTKKCIDEKWETLEKRIRTTGFKSAAGGSALLPGVGLGCDSHLIEIELNFYRKTLGVTDSDLKDLAEKTKTSVDELKRKYELKSFDGCETLTNNITKAGVQLIHILKMFAIIEAAKSQKVLPFVGCAMGSWASFTVTVWLLRSNLNLMVEDAKKIMDILVEETGRQINVMGISSSNHTL